MFSLVNLKSLRIGYKKGYYTGSPLVKLILSETQNYFFN